MDRKYTLEDVEYIRTRANVTYDEVIALLDAYEGDVIRVMAELERSGKLKSMGSNGKSFGETLKGLLRKGYENRMVVSKGERVVANFSIIFMLIALCFAFYVTIPALIFAIVFGYKVSFKKEAGAAKDFSDIIYTTKKAAESVKNEFKDEKDQKAEAEQTQAQAQPEQTQPQQAQTQPQQAQAQAQPQQAQSQNPPQPKTQSPASNPNQYARPDKDDDIIIE